MKPLVIALVGRPNVGKSTLFNALTGTRDALVVDMPGVTRDRQYGKCTSNEQKFILIDTGGVTEHREGIEDPMFEHAWQAVLEADIVFFLVDGRAGFAHEDQIIAQKLRQSDRICYLLVNKTDGLDPDMAILDFYQMGLGEPIAIAASQRRGIQQLMTYVVENNTQDQTPEDEASLAKGIRIALVGRPNVGKSTLTNRILGEERVIVYDLPGTTRDSIYIPFKRHDQDYTIIDTAGVRRRGKITEVVEKFSIVKTLQAIQDSNIVVMLMDATEGLTDQDLHLISFCHDAGRGLVVAFNKWDGLTSDHKNTIREQTERRLGFISDYIDIHFISALHGTGVGNLFKSVHKAYESAMRELKTPELTRILENAILAHQPPLAGNRRVKLKYAHAGGHNPPQIVIHGNLVENLPGSYQQYLINSFRKALNLKGTPVRISFKNSDNPYKDKKNKSQELTTRQQNKKRRLKKFVKKKS